MENEERYSRDAPTGSVAAGQRFPQQNAPGVDAEDCRHEEQDPERRESQAECDADGHGNDYLGLCVSLGEDRQQGGDRRDRCQHDRSETAAAGIEQCV
jgi:hypothetical protein